MRIYILFNTTIKFIDLPSKIDGSVVLDCIINGINYQLGNITASENKWYFESNDFIKTNYKNSEVNEILLNLYDFFYLTVDNYNILIYVGLVFDSTYSSYALSNTTKKLSFGNSSQNSVFINNSLFFQDCFYLNFEDNKCILVKNDNCNLFINNIYCYNKMYYINAGDVLWMYGVCIIYLNNILIINNPNNCVSVNNSLVKLTITDNDIYQSEKINDVPLYNKDEYFLRTPRIMRKIEEKEILIDKPPSLKKINVGRNYLITIVPTLIGMISTTIPFISILIQLNKGEKTFNEVWYKILTFSLGIVTSLLWPIISKKIQKHIKKRENEEITKKYRAYLEKQKQKIQNEIYLQTDILNENYINASQCIKIINSNTRILWERRKSQQDFLSIRIGVGEVPAQIKLNINDNEDHFELDTSILNDEMMKIVDSTKKIQNAPVVYSLLENNILAIMGNGNLIYPFLNNILLQLITFHGYDELKIVVFTDKEHEKKWDFLKNSPHCWDNYRNVRFFASTSEERLELSEMLNKEYNYRKYGDSDNGITELNYTYEVFPQYYIIFTDIITEVRSLDFIQNILNQNVNRGYSLVMCEKSISKMPEQCKNFINLDADVSNVLKFEFDKYENSSFKCEMLSNVNLLSVTQKMLNIPIEFDELSKALPETIGFLEMFGVGNIQQLNIANRWKTNDFTKSLRAQIGVNENNNPIYLDIHEKAHGPHGLIAGSTGSGKSEFIITYVLSLSLNYSPEEVSFILIDYKGGGLAGAFANKKKDLFLPHLAGTITNLDKSEMHRTLVSINSELKRRQLRFNEARDKLGESTLDIYKYQQFYREGKLTEPMPHLIIVSDEFAELKSQQPEFMDDLVSAARIGRSLGVHLILATQKPAGVVSGQIWSNSKFKICLRVQDKGDSMEMLKVADAAYLKNAGRFYLQVGLNELFLLGQSGWAGTQYFPTNIIKKTQDKTAYCVNNLGIPLAAANFSNSNKKSEKGDGDELVNVLSEITKVAQAENKKSEKLWLDSIPEKIYLEDIINKYNFVPPKDSVNIAIGEYDFPEEQKQNILSLNLTEAGNTVIFGNNNQEEESLITTMVYSICKYYTVDDVNIYIVDFGSETLRILNKLPQVGDMTFIDENEKIENLFKSIISDINKRKKLFADYGGSFTKYNELSEEKLPLKIIIINNYDVFMENLSSYDNTILQITRESQRYGIIFVISVLTITSLRRRIRQAFSNNLVLKFTNEEAYSAILGNVRKKSLASYFGRGFVKYDYVHEFQTATICEENDLLNKISELENYNIDIIDKRAPLIPTLPKSVSLIDVSSELIDITSIPIGILKKNLNVATLDFEKNKISIFGSNDIKDLSEFIRLLTLEIRKISNTMILCIDSEKICSKFKQTFNAYSSENFKDIINQVISYSKKATNLNIILTIVGFDKIISSIPSNEMNQISDEISKLNNLKLIVLENDKKFKKLESNVWFQNLFENSSIYWIGPGVTLQTFVRISNPTKEMRDEIQNNFAWELSSKNSSMIKIIECEEFIEEEEVDE